MENVNPSIHERLVGVINSLSQDEVNYFQALVNSLPEDDNSMSEMEAACSVKIKELGVGEDFFEKLVFFFFGYDEAQFGEAE